MSSTHSTTMIMMAFKTNFMSIKLTMIYLLSTPRTGYTVVAPAIAKAVSSKLLTVGEAAKASIGHSSKQAWAVVATTRRPERTTGSTVRALEQYTASSQSEPFVRLATAAAARTAGREFAIAEGRHSVAGILEPRSGRRC